MFDDAKEIILSSVCDTFYTHPTQFEVFLPSLHAFVWNLYPLTKYMFHDVGDKLGPQANAFMFGSITPFLSS